jgi:protocatechuate 3,4-dioxygenase beta subunit
LDRRAPLLLFLLFLAALTGVAIYLATRDDPDSITAGGPEGETAKAPETPPREKSPPEPEPTGPPAPKDTPAPPVETEKPPTSTDEPPPLTPDKRVFTGRVVDASGHPVRGARVELVEEQTGAPKGNVPDHFLVIILRSIPELLEEPTVSAETLSDAEGKFTLDATELLAVSFALRAAADGFAVTVIHAVDHTDGPHEVVLEPAVSFRGRVRTGSGAPVKGAKVVAARWGGMEETGVKGDSWFERQWTTTEEDGGFRFDHLKAGKYCFTAVHEGYKPSGPPGLISVPETQDIVIEFLGGFSITGRVYRKATGAPVPGAPIFARPLDGAGGFVKGETDSEGRYRIEGIRAGKVRLWLKVTRAPRENLIISGREGEEVVRDFPLDPGLIISGTVLNGKTNAPLQDVQVQIWPSTNPEFATTDYKGTFTLHVAPGDLTDWKEMLRLTASFGGFGLPDPPKVSFPENADRLDGLVLRMFPLVLLTGRVVDGRGEPVPWAKIGLSTVGDSGGSSTNGAAVSGQDGSFKLKVPFRNGLVTASREGLAFGYARYGKPEPGESIEDLVLVMSAGGKLEGRVIDHDGSPVPGIELVLFYQAPEGGREWTLCFGAKREVESDEDGRFVEEGLKQGKWKVLLHSKGIRVQAPVVAEVLEGGTTEVEVVLSEPLVIEGVVVDEGGAPVPDVNLVAYREEGKSKGYGTSDGSGRFVIKGLGPGPHKVYASHPDGRRADVEPVEAGTLDLRIVLGK